MPSMTQAGYTPPKAPDKKPKKKPAPRKKRKKKGGLSGAAIVSLIVFALACLIGAGTLYVYTVTAPYADTFLPGTMLLGYPLKGATMEEAEALLEKITADDVNGWTAEMKWDNQSYILSAKDVSLAVDADATLSPLWQRGRAGMLDRFIQILRMREEPMIAQPIVTYDMAAADELLGLIRQDIACEPENATVAFTPGSAQPFAYTLEAVGYSIDLTQTRADIESALARVEPAVIELSPKAQMPAVVREDLIAATVLRSRVVMELSGEAAALENIALAAAALSGARIEPGKTLSFNETVGERTAQRGYQTAAEPAYGDGVSGVGGGICQVSTALYRLALLGSLSVEQRSAAVYPVPYCEMGQEATVSGQGLDLVIGNPTAYPLFLIARTYASGGKNLLEMQLIGQGLDADYALVSGILEEKPAGEPVYVRDHEGKYATYTDQQVVAAEAKPGYVVIVDRVKLDENGSEISREQISQDEYGAIPQAIYVGVQSR